MKRLFLIIFLFVSGCDEKIVVDKTPYRVMFITGGQETYIGMVKGLSSCKYIAGNYYFLRRGWIKDWDYKCCSSDGECRKYDKE